VKLNVSKSANPTTGSPKAFLRRDATGHLLPQYEKDLLELAQESHSDDDGNSAFVSRPTSKDELAERLGEDVVKTATSGEQAEEK